MVHILLGQNSFTKKDRLNQLLTGAGSQAIYLESDQGLSPWFEVLGQSDLFGHMPVVVGNGQLDDFKTDQLEQLLRHIEQGGSLSDESLIVLMGKAEKLPDLGVLAEMLKSGLKVEHFHLLSAAMMMQWLKRAAAAKGLTVESRYLSGLGQLFGSDQFAASQQLEVWSLEGQPVIGQEQLLRLGFIGEEATVFGLTDSWSRKQLSKSLEQFHLLIAQSVEIQQLIGMLAWQAELLQACLTIENDGLTLSEIKSKAFNPVALQKTSKAARLWSSAELLRAIEGLLSIEEAMKSQSIDVVVNFELWLHASCGNEQQATRLR